MSAPSGTGTSTTLNGAQQLLSMLEGRELKIVNSKGRFDTLSSTDDTLPSTSLAVKSQPADPSVVTADVAAQLAFFRKLKFQYLEQKAKDQYIKTIVSDDAPNINAGDNEHLRQLNEEKKKALKEAKARLSETYSNIRTLSPLVEQDYHKAKSSTSEAVILAQKILDTRLQLTRLHQAYPHPRLTIPFAEEKLNSQVTEMQKLEDDLQQLNETIDSVKDEVKAKGKDVERLRARRSEAEKQMRAGKSDAEDSRVVGLYDWYTASLKYQKSLLSLESFHSASENELRLLYSLEPPASAAVAGHRQISITLLFVPNTRRLADVVVQGLPAGSDVSDLTGSHVQANDVPGLIAAVLARARAECFV